MRLIYLDYNTTTPMSGAAREAMLPFLYEFYGSPSNAHWTGAAVAEAIEDARTQVASLVGCQEHEILFTSGGTESINTALRCGMRNLQESHGADAQLLVTNWEHAATHRAAASLASTYRVMACLSGSNRGWDPDTLVRAVSERPTLLSISLCDGDTGIIQPYQTLLSKLEESGARQNCLIHLDCCQAIGKLAVDSEELDADLISITGHKMYASKGVGALVVRNDAIKESLLAGEYFERGLRNGMPNVAGIISMGAAADLVTKSIVRFESRCNHLFELFESAVLRCRSTPLASLLPNRGIANTRLLFLEGKDANAVMQRLPEICVKTFGSPESATGKSSVQEIESIPAGIIRNIDDIHEERFDALESAGINQELRRSAIRISIGWNTTEADMETAAESICEAYQQADVDDD